MSKSTVVNTLVGLGVAAVLLVSAFVIIAANSYVGCASRLLIGAPLTDLSPPPAYRRLAAGLWHHRDLYLARVLAQECVAGAPGGTRRFDRELFAAGIVKTLISPSQRETLGAVLLRAPDGGRGLTHAALGEWGRPPADLNDSEIAWIFVAAQAPSCSRQRVTPEEKREICASLYQSRLDEVSRLSK